MENKEFTFKPLTPASWPDFEDLFGKNGGCGGCWCMSFRIMPAEYRKNKGDGNKETMRRLAERQMTGLIAYDGSLAVGWCAMSPREEYLRIENSRILKRIDDIPVWSLPCFFIRKGYRRKGLSVQLLWAAIRYARENGIAALEGYPTVPYDAKMPDAFAWTGLLASFEKAGFEIVARNSKHKFIARYTFKQE